MGYTTTERRGTTSGTLARRKARRRTGLWVVIGLCCGALAVMGCERTEEHAAAAAPPPEAAPQHPGLVQLPPDSPQVQQLRVQPVDMVQVPTDEVTAPAKVVLNPNRIARIALPVPGRVTRLLVALGDAVTPGQPLLTIDSPDAHAAIAAALQAAVAAEQATKKSLDLTLAAQQLGAVTYLQVLTAQQAYRQALLTRVQAHAARLSDVVMLFQALGGGWWNRPDHNVGSEYGRETVSTSASEQRPTGHPGR